MGPRLMALSRCSRCRADVQTWATAVGHVCRKTANSGRGRLVAAELVYEDLRSGTAPGAAPGYGIAEEPSEARVRMGLPLAPYQRLV